MEKLGVPVLRLEGGKEGEKRKLVRVPPVGIAVAEEAGDGGSVFLALVGVGAVDPMAVGTIDFRRKGVVSSEAPVVKEESTVLLLVLVVLVIVGPAGFALRVPAVSGKEAEDGVAEVGGGTNVPTNGSFLFFISSTFDVRIPVVVTAVVTDEVVAAEKEDEDPVVKEDTELLCNSGAEDKREGFPYSSITVTLVALVEVLAVSFASALLAKEEEERVGSLGRSR